MASTGAASYINVNAIDVDKAFVRISFYELHKAFKFPKTIEIESAAVDIVSQEITLVLRVPPGVVPRPTDGSIWELSADVSNEGGIVLYGFRAPLPLS